MTITYSVALGKGGSLSGLPPWELLDWGSTTIQNVSDLLSLFPFAHHQVNRCVCLGITCLLNRHPSKLETGG